MTTSAYGPSRGFRHLDRRGTLLLLVVPAIALAVGRSVPVLDPISESVRADLDALAAAAADCHPVEPRRSSARSDATPDPRSEPVKKG